MLFIHRDDQGQLFLSVEGGTVTIGDSPRQPGVVLRNLRISRIVCEIDTEGDVLPCDAIRAPGSAPVRQELHLGNGLHIGHSQLRLEAAARGKAPGEEASPSRAEAPRPATPTGPVLRRLKVVDGADQGHSFRLPLTGAVTLGKSPKHADVVLRDLYISRVHCQVEVKGEKLLVTHLEGDNGTRINGQKINGAEELRSGDVLRIGNSHLRLETALSEDEFDDEEEVVAEEEEEIAVTVEEDEGSADEADDEESSSATHAPIDRLLKLEGQVLGHYRIGQLAGRGHFGLVFRAQDLKTNLVVALKVLSPDFPATGEELQRFVQALKTVTPLHHPNLVGLHGAGRTGQYCWIAREYVEGENVTELARRLRETGKFNWVRGARIAAHLARALAFLHQHKVVHGNVSPANVMIRSSDKQTKLADLLLGRALEGSQLAEAVAEKKLSAELAYLAPEQTELGAYVDHLADLYNLGAVVYTVLTGEPPFSGSSHEEILHQVCTAAPIRPTTHQHGIPTPFEAIVLKLLAKHQEDRYQSAAHLLADVEVIAAQHEVAL
jgi:pSer/pThr/pTyr-binding forkhead associated (FHA) protein